MRRSFALLTLSALLASLVVGCRAGKGTESDLQRVRGDPAPEEAAVESASVATSDTEDRGDAVRGKEQPCLQVFVMSGWLPSGTIVAIWEDGHVVLSYNRRVGAGPFVCADVRPEDVSELVSRIEPQVERCRAMPLRGLPVDVPVTCFTVRCRGDSTRLVLSFDNDDGEYVRQFDALVETLLEWVDIHTVGRTHVLDQQRLP